MKADDLMCIATLVIFIYYILDNIYARFSEKPFHKKTLKGLNYNLTGFYKKYNNRYNLYIPKKVNSIKLKEKILSNLKKITISAINKAIFDLNNLGNTKFQLYPTNMYIVKKYKNTYFVSNTFYCLSKSIKLKLIIDLAIISDKEYYILKIKEVYKKNLYPKYRKSIFYNKWLV